MIKELKKSDSISFKKTQLLFAINPQSASKSVNDIATVLGQLKQQLSDDMLGKIEQLAIFIHHRIGLFKECIVRPYRVTNMNYLAVEWLGQNGKFSLHITLVGYTAFPSLNSDNSYRLYLEACDVTDGFWLIELLKERLYQGFPQMTQERQVTIEENHIDAKA